MRAVVQAKMEAEELAKVASDLLLEHVAEAEAHAQKVKDHAKAVKDRVKKLIALRAKKAKKR